METVLDILWWALQIVGVLLAAALLVPLRFRLAGAIEDGALRARVTLRWGLGATVTRSRAGSEVDVSLLGFEVRRDVTGPLAPPEAWFGWQRGGGGDWAWEHRPALRVVFGRLLRALHLRGQVRGVIGLVDLERRAWVQQAAALVAANAAPTTLTLQSVPEGGVLLGRGRVRGWVWPLQLVVVGISLACRRDVREAFGDAEEISGRRLDSQGVVARFYELDSE